jgi:flagellar biosynthetic protein FlhB
LAENKDGQEKTEAPSAKRLTDARDKGQVSKSQDVSSAAVLLIGGISLFILGKPMFTNLMDLMKSTLNNISLIEITEQNINSLYLKFLASFAQIGLPIVLAIFVIILIAEISQVGLHWASKKFTEGLNFKQIFNPFDGIKRMFFSGRSAFELLKNILKLILMGSIVYQVIKNRAEEAIKVIELPYMEIGNYMASISFELVTKIGVVYIVVAVTDYFYQKYKFIDDMKMTKQEVKEETKQTEGDAKVKSRIRGLMRSRIRRLMLANVKNADVVITNPTHYAVALSYKQGESSAPKVVAKGLDFLALQIRAIAEENGIPIVEEPPLARAIYANTEIDQEIPENLFKAVAQILAYIYSLKNKKKSYI